MELWRLGHLQDALDKWLVAPRFQTQLGQIIRSANWFSADGTQGVITVSAIQKDSAAWHNFAIKAKNAGIGVGVPQPESWQLIASLEEIYTNVIEHSESIHTGIVAYAARPGSFEYVVCDAGIGVLGSLRKNPIYAAVPDAGAALELALSEGVSRKPEVGRGMGFRPIFVGLANISRSVRFRSGDYARTLARLSDGTLPASTLQRAWLNGLFCSVRLDASNKGGL